MKTPLYCGIFLLLIQVSYAQDSLRNTRTELKEYLVSSIKSELSLSQEQTRSLRRVINKRQDALESIRSAIDDVAQRREGIKLVNFRTRRALTRILNQEQYELFIQLRDETRAHKQAWREEHPGYVETEEDIALDF